MNGHGSTYYLIDLVGVLRQISHRKEINEKLMVKLFGN